MCELCDKYVKKIRNKHIKGPARLVKAELVTHKSVHKHKQVCLYVRIVVKNIEFIINIKKIVYFLVFDSIQCRLRVYFEKNYCLNIA
jgi:hypothetical protein